MNIAPHRPAARPVSRRLPDSAQARSIDLRVGLLLGLALLLVSPTAQAGTLVAFDFAGFGTVDIDLFDDLAPQSVNNFLQNYVTANRYNNTMLHRVDTGLGVIQGGGFDTNGNSIVTNNDPMTPLEYSRANTRGTLAAARTDDGGELANTATFTSQWFINTHDNSTTLGPHDGIVGTANPPTFGYAVFGWVVGPGMTVVDNLAAVPTFAYRSPFNQVPLTNFTQSDFTGNTDPLPHVVVLTSAAVVKTHPSYQNPFLATDVDNDGSLKAQDALFVINDLLNHGNHTLTAPFSGTNYLDTTGDNKVNAQDALKIINALLFTAPAHGAVPGDVSSLSLPVASPMVPTIPEPSSLILAATAAAALGGFALRRRRSSRAKAPASR